MDIRTPIPTNGGNWVSLYGDTWKNQIEKLQTKFGSKIEKIWMPLQQAVDVPVLFVQKDSILEILEFLKNDPACDYKFLADITATDEQPEEPRFFVVYQLFSHSSRARIRVKVSVNEGEEVLSATPLWKAANWVECEVWDMFGIRFKNHPGLRRLLMDDRWVGHPLRKDYPLRGYQLFPTAQEIHPEMLQDS